MITERDINKKCFVRFTFKNGYRLWEPGFVLISVFKKGDLNIALVRQTNGTTTQYMAEIVRVLEPRP